MTKNQFDNFIEDLNIDNSNFFLEVEGIHISLYDFLYANMVADDVDHITQADAQRVIDLQVGETIFIGLTEIQRVR